MTEKLDRARDNARWVRERIAEAGLTEEIEEEARLIAEARRELEAMG